MDSKIQRYFLQGKIVGGLTTGSFCISIDFFILMYMVQIYV